jgi:hypothetical protein
VTEPWDGFREAARLLEDERKGAAFARRVAEAREGRRIAEHFEEVALGRSASVFGQGDPIVLYDCRRCRALVRRSLTAQREHLRHTHGVRWEEPPDCAATVEHDPPTGSVAGLACALHGEHAGAHAAFHDGRVVSW